MLFSGRNLQEGAFEEREADNRRLRLLAERVTGSKIYATKLQPRRLPSFQLHLFPGNHVSAPNLQPEHSKPSEYPTTTSYSLAHHVRTKSPHQILPPRLRPLQDRSIPRSQASRPQSPNRPSHGTLPHEMHSMRRIYLQRAQVQRTKRDYGRPLLLDPHLPLLHTMHTMFGGDHVQDGPKEYGL